MQYLVDRIVPSKIIEVRDALIQRKKEGLPVYRLESGDPEFSPPQVAQEAAIQAVKDGLSHYCDSQGIAELRYACAEKLRKENGIDASAEEIVITNGAMHGLYCIWKSVLDEGDQVVIPDLNWVGSTNIIKLCGGNPITDTEYFKQGRFSDFILSNSPGNPSGLIDDTQVSLNVTLASRHPLVVSDEAYEHIIFDGLKHRSPGAAYDKTISVYSFSKSYAIPGWRLGYIHCKDPEIRAKIKKVAAFTCNGISTISQMAGLACLKEDLTNWLESNREIYQTKRNLLMDFFKEMGLDFIYPGGAFYIMVKFPKENFVNDLLQCGVGAIPGEVFGSNPGWVRLAYACPMQEVEQAIRIMRALL